MTWLFLLFIGPSSAAPPTVDVSQAVNQAQLFSKKGWHDEAQTELQQVIDTEEGRGSFAAHALMAQVYFDLQQADKAKRMAGIASQLALTPAEADAMKQLSAYINRTFGLVIIEGPYSGMSAPLRVESSTALLDPALKTWMTSLQERVSERVVLPHHLSLPAGEYLVNGMPVEIGPGQTHILQLPMNAISESGIAALQVSRLEFAMGTAMLFSERLHNLKPSVDFQLGVLQPAGSWVVGVHASWSLRSYTMFGSRTFRQPDTFMMGATLGREWLIGLLAVRPALGYRFGLLPGVELACNEILGKSPSEYYCTDPAQVNDPSDVEVYVYAIGRVHMPIMEIAVETQHAGETTALGLGLKVSVEPFLGRIPSPATANLSGDQAPLEYLTPETGFLGINTRILVQTVFAF